MKDDIYGNYKTHKASDSLYKEGPKKLKITDPRPAGSGNILASDCIQLSDCMFCGSPLDDSNSDYDATVIGYCDKLHRRDHEHQLLDEGRLVIEDPNTFGDAFRPPTQDWATGVWENITTTPINIQDKKHLLEVCEKHNVMPKALLKPKRDGKGYEARL